MIKPVIHAMSLTENYESTAIEREMHSVESSGLYSIFISFCLIFLEYLSPDVQHLQSTSLMKIREINRLRTPTMLIQFRAIEDCQPRPTIYLIS